MAAYVDHVVEQARFILQTQSVANLHATPPLLEAVARDDTLVDLVNDKIRYVLLSGAHIDLDTLDVLRDVFPHTAVATVFGSTMILSQAATRTVGESFVFDPRTPYVVFWVIDPDTGEQVPYGERGQVVMNHVSKGMFIPNNLERDTAIRMPGPAGHVGDSVSEVAPVAVFGGERRHRRRVLTVGLSRSTPSARWRIPHAQKRTRSRDTGGSARGRDEPRAAAVRDAVHRRSTRGAASAARRAAAGLARAAEIFATSTIGGLDFDAYVELTCRVSGLPMRRGEGGATGVADSLAGAFDAVWPARPTGATLDWRDATAAGGAVWARRGEVLAVHAPGNAPGVHGAVAAGPGTGVPGGRPRRRGGSRSPPIESSRPCARPVFATRMRCSCRPTTPPPTNSSDAADLALVYGGQDVVGRYAADPTVLVNGPGRTKILITAEQDWRDYLDVIVDSIAGLGGMACVNATAVLYEGDPAPLAHAIADRLSAIDAAAEHRRKAILPTTPVDNAHALADYLGRMAAGTEPILGADQVVADLGDGYAALRPAVHLLRRPDVHTINVELPFPCVWVSGWTRGDGLGPLRNSLVISAITADDALIDQLLDRADRDQRLPRRGPHSLAAPHIPHDGYLADFLMRNKGFVSAGSPE